MIKWWEEKSGFFNEFYMLGDNSIEGYIPDKEETLEQRTEREVKGIINLLKIKKKSKILDCPCGYGRHTIELAKLGYYIDGMDINEKFLKIAQQSWLRILDSKKYSEHNSIRLYKASMLDFHDKEHNFYGKKDLNYFDIIINMFYSFGFFRDDESNEKVMKNFYNALKKKGKLLIHTDVSPEMILEGEYHLNEKRNLKDKGKLLIKEKYNQDTNRINGTWTIINKEGNEKTLTSYSMRIYSAPELIKIAKSCGFRKTKIYGSFKGNKFTSNSNEMILVAQK